MLICSVFVLCRFVDEYYSAQVTGKLQYSGKNIRLDQLMMNEIEFEWLRQFYIQGERHRQLHVWWHAPMQVIWLLAVLLSKSFEFFYADVRQSRNPLSFYPFASHCVTGVVPSVGRARAAHDFRAGSAQDGRDLQLRQQIRPSGGGLCDVYFLLFLSSRIVVIFLSHAWACCSPLRALRCLLKLARTARSG